MAQDSDRGVTGRMRDIDYGYLADRRNSAPSGTVSLLRSAGQNFRWVAPAKRREAVDPIAKMVRLTRRTGRRLRSECYALQGS